MSKESDSVEESPEVSEEEEEEEEVEEEEVESVDLETGLNELLRSSTLGVSGASATHYERALKKAMDTYTEAKKAAEEIDVDNEDEKEVFLAQEEEKPSVVKKLGNKKLVYFAYSYVEKTPQWAIGLKALLTSKGFLVFLPSEPVEAQFDPEDLDELKNLSVRVVTGLCKMLKLSENLTLPITNSVVIQKLRSGDTGFELDALLFKELYFLVRASLVIGDVIKPPYHPETVSKLNYAKLLDIPTVGLCPGSQVMNPWVSTLLKVVMTDEFSPANIMPLVHGYTQDQD